MSQSQRSYFDENQRNEREEGETGAVRGGWEDGKREEKRELGAMVTGREVCFYESRSADRVAANTGARRQCWRPRRALARLSRIYSKTYINETAGKNYITQSSALSHELASWDQVPEI